MFDGSGSGAQMTLDDKRASGVTQRVISYIAMGTVPDSDELLGFMGLGRMTGISQRWFIDSVKPIATHDDAAGKMR